MPADEGSTRGELVHLTQLLAVGGTTVVGAFAALHGMHHTDVDALTRVVVAQERGTPMTAGALAEDLGLTSGAITGVVDRLGRAGHVNRVRDDADRREIFLHCSPSGRALAEEFFTPLWRRSRATTDHFTRRDLEAARRYLAATGAAMATTARPWCPGPRTAPPRVDTPATCPAPDGSRAETSWGFTTGCWCT